MQSLRNNENNESLRKGTQSQKRQGESLTATLKHAEKQTDESMGNESQMKKEMKGLKK